LKIPEPCSTGRFLGSNDFFFLSASLWAPPHFSALRRTALHICEQSIYSAYLPVEFISS
jgi:hypothetical protein